MEEANICRWHLIVASVDQGEVDQVMDAARAAGATGGTILHAPKEGKTAIMQAIARSVPLEGERGGVVFSLPVDSIEGLNLD